FGGIMKCDVIANGIVAAAKNVDMTVPLVVRLEGTNVEAGKKILRESGVALTPADSLAQAAEIIVEQVKNAG
ncbi:MAG: succinate--CoA ligase subunit beta, partial [Verrucomicrobiota bacterium]|nr:succinate--CoA ligase subunit beta [Verrucomicrobiota bacterium]